MDKKGISMLMFGYDDKFGRRIVFFSILLLVTTLVIIGGVKMHSYYTASKICAQIRAGEEISTNFSNGTTAPRFFNKFTDIMQIDGPKIPLVEACYYRNIQAVERLLANGADPNIYFDNHYSPLEAALAYGPINQASFEIVKLLVENGANVNAHASSLPIVVQLSGYICAGNDNECVQDILVYLLDHGADSNWNNYNRVFFDVIRSGNVKFTEYLIEEFGFNINQKGINGQSPLITAVTYSKESASIEMVELLLRKGADRSITDDNKKNAFEYAQDFGYIDMLDMLNPD